MSVSVIRLSESLAGRYSIEREIGKGGMATVYLAADVRHRRRVAIKVLHPELAQAIGPARFLREIEIAANLNHPHILPLHDSGEADGLLYYVMPYVEGESLRDRLKREKQLAVADAIAIARDVADALEYAHARGVIHRDIKPANIMLEAKHAVVSDFGVAFEMDTEVNERLTSSGFSIGTLQYMSPEQVTGERSVDARTDVYSLACVLYEMLSGEPPFTGRTPQIILARKIMEAPPSLRTVRPAVSERLEAVIRRSLVPTPADRFASAAEFVASLGRTVTAEPADVSTAEIAPPVEAALRGRDRRRALLWAVPALFAVTTVIGFVTGTAYDLRMRLPDAYTPSRLDLPVVGAHALVPLAFYAFVLLAGYVALRYVVRVLMLGAGRLPGVGRKLSELGPATTTRLKTLSHRLEPATAAELFFIGAVAVSVAVLLGFRDFLNDLWTAETAGFSGSLRSVHRTYTFVMTVLIVGLGLGWRAVFRSPRMRGNTRVSAARWGSLAWIFILLLITTAPWRLVWNNERPRALLDGERAYILVDGPDELVIYNAERRSTQLYRASELRGLTRLNTVGYVFEDEQTFHGRSP